MSIRKAACAAPPGSRLLWRIAALAAVLVMGPMLAVAQPKSQERLRPVPRALVGLPGTVKLDMTAGVPVVEATLGEHSLRLIVDTGASWSMLTPEAARRLGLEPRAAEELSARDAAGEAKAVEAAHIESLSLATAGEKPVTFRDFDVIVMESALAKHAGVDGILALPVLRRTVVRFDFAAGRMELGAEKLPEADGESVLPLTMTPQGLAGLEVSIKSASEGGAAGAPPMVLIDTGFSGGLHLPQNALKDLADDAATRRTGVASTAHRERVFQQVRLEADLHVGRYRIVRPVASVFEGEDGESHGALGMQLLRRFTLTLDMPNRLVRLEAPKEVLEAEEGPASREAGEANGE